MLDLAFRPDPAGREPVYRQLADHFAALVAAGRLRPGERLPPTRELAEALGLSRNTVTRAYEWLGEAGFLGAHVGRGTFVAGVPRKKSVGPRALEAVAPAFAWPALFAARARALRIPRGLTASDASREAPRFDFRPGRVDTHSLPVAELQGAWQRAVGQLRERGNLDSSEFSGLTAAISPCAPLVVPPSGG